MNILQIIAVISTLLCVYLTTKENKLGWVMAIISAISLILVYIENKFYGQIVLQTIFLGQAIYGWYSWSPNNNLQISKQHNIIVFSDILCVIGLSAYISNTIQTLNPDINSRIYLDNMILAIGILGEYYLIKKYIQSWLLFMCYNIILMIMLFIEHVYLIAGLNIILCCISFTGYIRWRKILKTC